MSNSLNNSRKIAISGGWTERPSHHDIEWIVCQKSHLTGRNLILFYFLKLNMISSMAIYSNESKKSIIILCFLLQKSYFVSFYWCQKKLLNKKNPSKKITKSKIQSKVVNLIFFLEAQATYLVTKIVVWTFPLII